MWFVGALLGLIIGSIAGGAGLAFTFAIVGGVAGGVIGSAKKKKNQAWRAPDSQSSPAQSEESWGRAEPQHAQQRINQLEQRVEQLEYELAELREIVLNKAETAAHTMPAMSRTKTGEDAQASTALQQTDQVVLTVPVAEPEKSDLINPAREIEPAAVSRIAPLVPASETMPEVSFESLQHSLDNTITAPAKAELPGDEFEHSQVLQMAPELVDETGNTSALSQPTQATKPIIPAKLQPDVPPLSWRERLPAPLATFIFGGNWLVKSGVAILFLGLAFLLRYTSEYISIPVEFRYAGVAAAALTGVVLGWRLRFKNANFGLALQGLGIGCFYLTALFALKLHHLIDHLPCFVFLFAMSVLAAALAVLQKAPSLAIIASLAGFATPVLSGSGENNPVGLFTYLTILDLGIAIVAWFQAWRVLNLIGFAGTFALAAGWAERYYSEASYGVAQAYLIVFGLLYAFIGWFYARNTLRESHVAEGIIATVKRVGRIDSALVFGLPITAFAIQYALVKDFYLGSALAAVGYALFYLGLARLVYSRQLPGLGLLAEAYLIVAAIFVTLAVPLALENSWTGAAWAVEGAGMYWLGVRQQRAYARAFAFVVLLGAWSKLSFALSFNSGVATTVLAGSWIGPLLLLASCVTVWRLYPALNGETHILPNDAISLGFQRYFSKMEPPLRQASLWLGWLALVCLCWVLFDTRVASVIQAIAGALLIRLADRNSTYADFHWRGVALQVLAVLQFAITLQLNPQDGALLASGWQGILASCLIALAILSNIVLSIIRHRQQSLTDKTVLVWSAAFNVGMLVASWLVQFSLLFALSLDQAAIVWSLSAALFIALALYLANFVLAAGSGLVMLASLVVYLFSNRIYDQNAAAFWNLQFAAPLSLSLACLWVAERIYQAAKKGPWIWPVTPGMSVRWHNGWCHRWQSQLLPLLVGLWFWFSAFSVEPGLWLAQKNLGQYWGAAQLLCALASAALLFVLAKQRNWLWAGYAQFIYLPWFAWLFDSLRLRANYQEIAFVPIAGVDYLLWIIALASHFLFLRKAQAQLTKQSYFLQAAHASGLWFFVLLFSVQLHALSLTLTQLENAWTASAWVVWPMLGLVMIAATRFKMRWPWAEWREFYLTKAAYPMLLFSWMWFIYAALTQSGDAQPLPFVSVLNPVELAQVFCILITVFWWRELPVNWQSTLLELRAHYLLAAATLLFYTTLVLRACSQYAAIPYELDALFDSKLAQAAVSVAWALAAVIGMLIANRRMHRSLWVGGAVLLATVVLKLFVIELADHGGLYRIISFIVVGLLLLIVGYFAPYPGTALKQEKTAELNP